MRQNTTILRETRNSWYGDGNKTENLEITAYDNNRLLVSEPPGDIISFVQPSLSIVASGSCFGWITPILSHLLGPESEIPISATEAPWVISVIELGNLLSPLPAGLLADRFGRKPVILATGPMYIISWLMILHWPSALMLALARTLQGLSIGFAFTTTPIYLGEIASNSTRGAIASMFSNALWFGFLISYAVGPFLSLNAFTYFTLAINIPFLGFYIWVPESPYYYLMIGNEEKAEKSLMWLRDNSVDKLRDELEEMKQDVIKCSTKPQLKDVIQTPEDRRALCLLLVLSAVRGLSGTGSIMVYATQIFDLTPHLAIPSYIVTIALGVVMLIGGITSSILSDSFGRRPLLMISCIGSVLSQLCTGTYYFLLFHTSIDVSDFSWIAPSLILVYSFLCSAGLYPVHTAYTSELFNSNTRGMASSLSSINVTICAFVMLVCYQPIADYIGYFANFYFFAICTLFGAMYFYSVAPETKAKSFVEIRKELLKRELKGDFDTHL